MALGWTVLVFGVQCVHWTHASLFPTYSEDVEDLEDAEGRFGIISLSPSTSTANYTINLTGLLLLGLALASALTLWAYLSQFFGSKGYGSSYGHEESYGGYQKRALFDSTEMIPLVLSNLHERFEKESVTEDACKERILCESGSPSQDFAYSTFGHATNTFFSQVEKENMMDVLSELKRGKLFYEAWQKGAKGKNCTSLFSTCTLSSEKLQQCLESE